MSDQDSTRANPASRPPSDWARRRRVGDRVGDHVLERELGEGGMGSVFVARHVTTGQERALKVMLVDPAENADALERFRREGQAQAAGGKHPNVLQVHAAGEQAGCAFLVMELARGGDLKARLRQGPLEPRAAATLIAGLARGLAHVHAQGVLHRDLKPANVVFAEDGTPKLMDFGLARLAGSDKLTQTGTLLGTPAYMSPEQAGGEPLDERADVYGLGAVLYHCLTGRPPFAGDSAFVVVRKVLTDEPTPPREVNPDVPPALEQLVLRALAKTPEQRFASATALACELDRFVRGELIATPPARGRRALALGLAASLSVLVGAALLLRRGDPGPTTGVTDTPAVVPVEPPAPSETRIVSPPLADAGDLHETLRGWSVVGHGVTRLELVAAAETPGIELHVDHVTVGSRERKHAQVLAVGELRASVDLAVGWTSITLVRTADKQLLDRRDVVRLPATLERVDRTTVRAPKDGSQLRLVPPGTVLMHWSFGTPSALERFPIERPFFMGIFEVTWRQLRQYADDTGAELPPSDLVGHVVTPEEPAFNLLLPEAHAYCEWAGLRVPESWEWVYAATGGDRRVYPWGDEPKPGSPEWDRRPLANLLFPADGFAYTAPVGSFEAGRSPFGLHDMIGNVWEWVVPFRVADNPMTAQRTYGGGWSDTAAKATSRTSSGEVPGERASNTGLRVAADVD